MDKNKSRTDLLAAGRKKLQQYRQKKDTKISGNQGKSLKKGGREQHDISADVGATTSVGTSAPHVSEGENTSLVDCDPGTLISVENALELGIDSTADSSKSVSVENAQPLELDSRAGSSMSVSVENAQALELDPTADSSTSISVENAQALEFDPIADSSTSVSVGNAQALGLDPTADSSTSVSAQTLEIDPTAVGLPVPIVQEIGENETGVVHTADLLPQEVGLNEDAAAHGRGDEVSRALSSRPSDAIKTGGGDSAATSSVHVDQSAGPVSADTADGLALAVELEGRKKDEQLLPSQESILPVPLTTERLNAITDEADGFGSSQPDRGSQIELEGDRAVPISRHHGGADALSEISPMETSVNETTCDMENIDTSEERSGVPSESSHGERGSTNDGQHPEDGTAVNVSDQQSSPLEIYAETSGNTNGGNTPSSIAVVNSMSPLQLSQIVSALSDEDLRSLLEQRQLTSDVRKVFFEDGAVPNLLERLKEEIIFSNFTSNVFQLQISEQSEQQKLFDRQHHELLDKISHLNRSLGEVGEMNRNLVEELSNCRTELHSVRSAKEELEKQVRDQKSEVDKHSGRACELENSLEKLQEDILRLSIELDDCKRTVASFQVEKDDLNSAITLETGRRKKVVEENESYHKANEKMSTELTAYKSLVSALEVENSNLTGSLSSVTQERRKLEMEMEILSQGNEALLAELENNRNFVAALQEEMINLNRSTGSLSEERTKLLEERYYLSNENDRLSTELLVLSEKLSQEQVERTRFEFDLKEAMLRFEQLTEENTLLKNTLDSHNAIVEDFDGRKGQMSSPVAEAGKKDQNPEVFGRGQRSISEGMRSHNGEGSPAIERGIFHHSYGFGVLAKQLDEAGRVLPELEKAIEEMHSHSSSVSRSSSEVAAPPISKLIQAFESKANPDEREVEEGGSIENKLPGDPYVLSKNLTGNLGGLLRQMGAVVENAHAVLIGERDHDIVANGRFRELKDQYEALESHNNDLVTANIEALVLYEALKICVGDAGIKIIELEALTESLRHQELSIKISKSELAKRLCTYELKITELGSQLNDLQQYSSEMTSLTCSQLDNLLREAMEGLMILEQNWNSCASQIVERLGKLNESLGKSDSSTISSDVHDGVDISSCIAVSVTDAIMVIEDLREKVEAAITEKETISSLYKEVKEEHGHLCGRHELTVGLLQNVYSSLQRLASASFGSDTDTGLKEEYLNDPPDHGNFDILIEKLGSYLRESVQLKSLNSELHSELLERKNEYEEHGRRSLESNAADKLIENALNVLKLDDADITLDEMPGSRFEALVSLLLQKYKEAGVRAELLRSEYDTKVAETAEMQEVMDEMVTSALQHENEKLFLKESLGQAEEALVAAHSQLKQKLYELEQSEQRVSSIREKLSIAVAKGKGLVVQRDSLKQSLAETSSELERCLQELQLKDARIHEVETKLKDYSEAGERVEALESELSYIRNSATALRESFLLKDSVLQRIEEILEELDLPEHFHSRDIIEKVDWLARSVTGNSLPHTDWEQRSSAAGGSYSDIGTAAVESWKDDEQPSSISGDDFRRKYEELQNKFYEAAEQNEMLEQSLVERNKLVQRWEELLGRIDIPSQLLSMEPEDRIEWMGRSLAEAINDRKSLQERIDYFESYCGSLSGDLDESQRKVSSLQADLEELNYEREQLYERIGAISRDSEKLSIVAIENAILREILQNEVSNLEHNLRGLEVGVKRLEELVWENLQDPVMKDLVSGSHKIEGLELLLMKLIDHYTNPSLVKSVVRSAVDEHRTGESVAVHDGMRAMETVDSKKGDIDVLNEELDNALLELMHVREDRNRYKEMHESLITEAESLDKKRAELHNMLNQEEQKSASVKEKLNVAVRKGKQLVQQRDSLKQTIEEMTRELDKLKSKNGDMENVLAKYEERIRDLSTYPERVEALESENVVLRNQLIDVEQNLQEEGHTLRLILKTLGGIDVSGEDYSSNPVEKLEQIGNLCSDLRAAMISLEEEAKKSRKAAELLLAELNEVQERNDGFQEELTKVSLEHAELIRQRDMAEASKVDALSHLEKLSTIQLEERRIHASELMRLKSGLDQVGNAFQDISYSLADTFSKDLDLLHSIEAVIESCFRSQHASDVVGDPLSTGLARFMSDRSDGKEKLLNAVSWSEFDSHGHLDENAADEVYSSIGRQLQELVKDVGAVKEMSHKHSMSLDEEASCLTKLIRVVHGEVSSQKVTLDSLKKDVLRVESIGRDKDTQLDIFRRNIGVLSEACITNIIKIGQRKAELVGKTMAAAEIEISSRQLVLSSEESIRFLADRLLFEVGEFLDLKVEMVDNSQKEMKTIISNLRKELQEKDIEKDRVCMELVKQIKDAEASANGYSQELQSSKTRVRDSEKRIEEMEFDRDVLEQRVEELQNGLAASVELEERIKSLTNVITAKDQEIEALMQALDEEEVQMEGLTKKMREQENILKQKNLELDNLEASRGKAMKKLSVTVTKFDELHHLSESLLTEVEKLQLQLRERDDEISFLRQEVTRCTNDALAASQMSNKKDLVEIHEFLKLLDIMIARVGLPVICNDDDSQVHNYKDILQKKMASVVENIEDLQAVSRRKDDLLQVERSKVEELTRKEKTLAKTLREKEAQLNLLEGAGGFESANNMSSEIMEVEPLINKRPVPGTSVTPQVRSLRKVNTDQVAIAIDTDPGSSNSRLDDEDDDKVHGFKSLTTSRIVPKFTRPVTDMIDGLWVSCDRTLMRKPALRLGIIIYWAVLHALLATYVV